MIGAVLHGIYVFCRESTDSGWQRKEERRWYRRQTKNRSPKQFTGGRLLGNCWYAGPVLKVRNFVLVTTPCDKRKEEVK